MTRDTCIRRNPDDPSYSGKLARHSGLDQRGAVRATMAGETRDDARDVVVRGKNKTSR